MGPLLLPGMLAGLLASLIAFGFAKVLGEQQVNRAIEFEQQLAKAAGPPGEPDIVSREVQ